MKHTKRQARFRVIEGGLSSTGYKSGLKRWRGMPLTDSTARTRSAGTRPHSSQPDTLPWLLSPIARASAVCPPTISQASKRAALGASFAMPMITAQTDNRVNAYTVNGQPHNVRMAKKTTLRPSAFWQRLEDSLGKKWEPFNPNAVATRLKMSQGSVHRWFSGEGFPELDTALYLAKEGGVCVDWLLNNVKPKYPISKDPQIRELIEICESLDTDARARILRIAQGESALENGENALALLEGKRA